VFLVGIFLPFFISKRKKPNKGASFRVGCTNKAFFLCTNFIAPRDLLPAVVASKFSEKKIPTYHGYGMYPFDFPL
jgi:hypothetical protein